MKTKLAVLLLVLFGAGGALRAQTVAPIVNGVVTIDASLARSFKVNVSATITGVAIVNPSAGEQLTVLFLENATGGFTVAFGGNVATCTVTTTANAATQCGFVYDIGNNQWNVSSGGSSGSGITSVSVLPATCTPGVTNPEVNFTGSPSPGLNPCIATNQFVGLTSFFGRFFGAAPQDYGAKGDTHVYGGAGMVGNSSTLTNVTSIFSATDCQTGTGCTGPVNKQFDFTCPGGAVNPIRGTITSFNSATSVGTSATCTVTVTNQALFFGTDDTAALQAWVTAINQPAVKGVTQLAHGGYLPQGGYWTQKALRFIYPGGQDGVTGECAPAPALSLQIRCSLWLLGAGTDNSYIYAPSDFNWAFPNTTSDNGVVFLNHWDFMNISQFAIQATIAGNTAAWNTTANTGVVGCFVFEDNSHASVTMMYVAGCKNTTNTMPGAVTVSDFESYYGFNAFETNDINWWFDPLNSSASTGVLNAGNFEKIYIDSTFLENATSSANGNMQIFCCNLAQFRMHNIHFRADSQQIADINFRPSVTVANGDAFICDECRVTNGLGTGALGFVFQGTGRYVFSELQDYNSNATSPGTTSVMFDIAHTGNTVTIQGGSLNCSACTNAVNFAAAGSTVVAMDLTLVAPTNHANFSTGTGTVNAFFRTATGWDGPGVLQSTQYISNQGVACTNGELALSAGWQSTGSATVTAVAGTGQTCSWTITTGTTTAANPTVTDTLTNVLPTATTVCYMSVNGGTHTPVVGAGTSDTFRQTTLSATAPIFTYQETPTAGGTTYFVTRTCGP